MSTIVLVTGARGLLGSTLVEVLPTFGYRVAPSVTDIRDKEAVREEILRVKPDVIIHTAALANVATCEKDPAQAQAVNVEGTKHIIEAAREVGVPLIHISTVSLLTNPEGNGREDDEPHAFNVYNRTKLEAERAVLEYEKGATLRINIIGVHKDGSRGRNFLEWLVNSFTTDQDMSLYIDERVNPLSNWTLARLIGRLIALPEMPRILHLGSRTVLSKSEIGHLVAQRYPAYRGVIENVPRASKNPTSVQPLEMWLNTDLATELLGPMPKLEEELELVFHKPPFAE